MKLQSFILIKTKDMAVSSRYGNQQEAVKIAKDLTGFVYYPDSRVALCETASSDYQNNHFCYDKNGQLLAAVDSLGIGFVQTSNRKDADIPPFFITFTASGGLITTDNKISSEWAWAHVKGQPTTTIRKRLNEHIIFVYENRATMFLEFECDGIKYTADLGVKQRRKDPSYLTTAKRSAMGHLVLPNKAKSLKERTEDFNKSMLVKHNLVHPKSENLSGMVSGIVSKLENTFGGVNERMMTSPSPGKTWKGDAFNTTITELPKISLSGAETGKVTGLGSSIYSSLDATATKAAQAIPGHLVYKGGGWKTDTDVRASLQEINPVLKRTNVLKCNSGRYSDMLVVEQSRVTHKNPTGMVVPEGVALDLLRWKDLKVSLEEQSSASIGGGLLTVALIGRVGEPRYAACMRMAELANLRLQADDEKGGTPKFRLLRIEVGENSDVLHELKIKYLPTFVMWSGGKVVYQGQAGGMKVSSGPVYRPKVLLIESQPKLQLSIEKHLKKANCDSYLCLTSSHALEALQRIMSANDAFDVVLVSADVLESQASELSILRGKLTAAIESKRTVVAAMVSTVGEHGRHNLRAFSWDENTCSKDVADLNGAARLCTALIQKPVKGTAISSLLNMCSYRGDDLYVQLGVTPEAFVTKMNNVREEAAKGTNAAGLGKLHLSIQDVRYAGTQLVVPRA